MDYLGFMIGMLFGAALFLAGLANPDKIIGTLRLKDLHAMKTIAVFVIVGMVGFWFLDKAGVAHYSVKPANILAVLLGGAFLGVGFGLTGYCPGTGLACAAAGRLDALITVLGMFVGAALFIFIYPSIVVPIDGVWAMGKKTIPEVTGISAAAWVFGISVPLTVVLFVTAKFKKK
ncbi:MAG: YeeE/YedE family protein [Phycisphaerae bacterium]|nr:YeeE/YedE family protein [Phycisphaerae bacterium]